MGLRIKKNGKIITLSESDLRRITMKLLREQDANEQENAEDTTSLDVELDEIDEDNPDPTKLEKLLVKIDNFLRTGDLPKNLHRFKRKIKKMFTKHGDPKKHKNLGTQCPKW
jgi:hypothetical protein